MKQIDFYFDFLSPYSFLAWEIHKRSLEEVEKEGFRYLYIPVVLSRLIKHYETKGPAEIKPKREYLMRDILRFCAKNSIELNPPKLPFNSMSALKICLREVAEKKQFEFIDTLFSQAWREASDIGDEKVLNDLFSKNLILKSQEKDTRVLLNQNLKDALSCGVFGLPSFYIKNEKKEELFWGKDSLEDLVSYVKGFDTLDIDKYKNFQGQYLI